jgi:prevent-host-death family protein
VLTDAVMPEMDGVSLLRMVRDRNPDITLVLMLNEPSNTTAIKAAEVGVFQCLVKPIEPLALQQTADLAVRRHRSRLSLISRLRNQRGESMGTSSFTATEAKNEFGRVLDKALQGEVVLITRHETPFVLLAVDEFKDLVGSRRSELDTLRGEFDALLARMQTAEARAGIKAAFDATPAQLGRAAVAAARKRR